MSHHTCEITEQYLDRLYDDCIREEARLLADLRNCSDITEVNDRDIQRQGQMLHTIAQTEHEAGHRGRRSVGVLAQWFLCL